ncbi:MAG: hypothetical protein LBH18_04365, partial [Spirochaetaceae bacterium]|nr:hypothetical protein [Spirochaetaceae bacterium]
HRAIQHSNGLEMASFSHFGGVVGTIDSAGKCILRNISITGNLKYSEVEDFANRRTNRLDKRGRRQCRNGKLQIDY